MKNPILSTLSRILMPGVLALAAGSLTACNEQGFVTGNSETLLSEPGTYYVPAKADIVLVEDDSGSVYQAHAQIASQMPPFLEALDDQGWDYRFATLPLTKNAYYGSGSTRALTQIVASKFDTNWGSEWIAPFPGANYGDHNVFAVWSSYFRTPNSYNDFIDSSDINPNTGSQEPGFQTIRESMTSSHTQSKFLRSDAMLIFLVLSNGNDTSLVQFCTRSDGWYGPCDDPSIGQPGTSASSYTFYKNLFRGFKPSASQVKMYSVVANSTGWSCVGNDYSIKGTRYINMATDLGGASYNLCNTTISSALTGMSQHLQAIQKNFRIRYIVLGIEPEVSTMKIYRLINGDPNQKVLIPQSATNGWTYIGHQTNIPRIDSPAPMSQATGYTIELHGTGKIEGKDKPYVDFVPKGFQSGY